MLSMLTKYFSRKTYAVILFTLFSILSGLILQSFAADLEEIKKLDKEVLLHKKQISLVKEGIRTHQSKVSQAKSRELTLLAELEEINGKIEQEKEKIAILQNKMAEQDILTAEKLHEMENVFQEKETLRHFMEKRLAAYYRIGDIGILNATFSRSSLPELLAFEENFHLMLRYDHEFISNYKTKITELNLAVKAHEEQKNLLARTTADVIKQQKVLADIHVEQQKLLARVNTEKKLYQQAIEEMESASQALQSTLEQLEEKAVEAKEEREFQRIKDHPLKAFKKRKPASERGFAAQKGKLPLPASGSILQKFGQQKDSAFGVSTFANGIDIESAPGTDIIAVYEGKIVYAGTLRGYGQLIIIDHGKHYFSLVSGVGDIISKVGDHVDQYEKIGVASLHTGVLQEGLHFEIRHNTEAQDPLEWIDSSQVAFKIN